MNKKLLFIFTLILLFTSEVFSQCTSISIPKTSWTIESYSTQENTGEGVGNGQAIHCIDNNPNTIWHSQWQGTPAVYPHQLILNLGAIYPVNGMIFVSRLNSASNKPKGYTIFTSIDNSTWSGPQSSSDLMYANVNASGSSASINFGAVNAKYIKVVFTSNYNNNIHCALSEVFATQISGPSCIATGQNNQILTLDAVPKKYTTDASFNLNASLNTDLPITYSIVSGPATVVGNTVNLTGASGTVIVKASNIGNAAYYPVETTRTFEVVDLSTIAPVVSSRLTAVKNIQMPSLMAYQLFANATIAESTVLNIANIQFYVDGNLQTSTFSNNSYKCMWTPASYGNHTIEIKATGSNGVVGIKTVIVNVVNTINSISAPAFTNAVIDFGSIGSQWYYGTYTFPQSVGAYNQITANFTVTCPEVNGGCDDWDRLAWCQIKNPDGQWIELFRYITPYGVACNHSIDVTDYESLLQGEVEFRMYIETWGTGGWKLDLNLDYTQGMPAYLYSAVEEIWQGNYNFGNPAELQPVPIKNIVAPQNTQNAKFRLVTTGHGWGSNNTGNAAEFYNATHKLRVNNTDTFNQVLWTSCNPNPSNCTGQMGTWQYSRAGWCPGHISVPYTYDLTPYITNPFTFQYQFKTTYKDLCHPNNPACVSGVTCTNCNDGYNPYYRIGGYMIYKGNTPLITLGLNTNFNITENNVIIYPNPNNGIFKISMEKDMTDFVVNIINVNGESIKTYYFKEKAQLDNHTFDIGNVATGIYFIKVYDKKKSFNSKVMITE